MTWDGGQTHASRRPSGDQAALLARLARFAEDEEGEPRLAGFARALPPMLGLE